MPDLRGALLLSASVALLTLGVVQGTSWVWDSPATLGAFAAALVGTALTVRSSLRHPSPVLDPVLLRMRAFGVSNLVTLVAGLGLYTYLLAHILWLHYVWGYSLLVSGLAVAPGAIVAALVARPCGKLADRFSPRAVVVPGALVWAAAFVWYAAKVGVRPNFLGQWLPAQIASGIGAGSTLVVAAGGGLATVPAGRYATASAGSLRHRVGRQLERPPAGRCAWHRHPHRLALPPFEGFPTGGRFLVPPRAVPTPKARRACAGGREPDRQLPDGRLCRGLRRARASGTGQRRLRRRPGRTCHPSVRHWCASWRWAKGPTRNGPNGWSPQSPSPRTPAGSVSSSSTRSNGRGEAGLHAGRAAVAALYELAVP